VIKKLHFYISNDFDPYANLAREKYLFDEVDGETFILYLWQNQNTVVIGKNQNALAECRTELLESEGGHLARRLSGGGAVFHDLGNLNFTFLCATENFDVDKQLSVIQRACALAGIATERSGRNDVLADGRKFSGNAFYHSKGHSYHHGTLMIAADTEKMTRYLTPPKAKLEAKGVKSVRSRVVNLTELAPTLTCARMKEHLLTAFREVYGLPHEPLDEIKDENIAEFTALFGSRAYLYGSPLPFNVSCSGRLSFGSVELQMQVTGGVIADLKLYTDALDTTLPDRVAHALISRPVDLAAMRDALQKALPESEALDLVSLLSDQIFS